MESTLRSPFPWFGGKSKVANMVWERFGERGERANMVFAALLVGE